MLTDLEEVFNEVINNIKNGQDQVFEIAENVRSETERIKLKLEEIKQKVISIIDELDKLESMEKAARIRLMQVSKNIKKYGEADIHRAYQAASEMQAKKFFFMNKENELKRERNELELILKKNIYTVDKADELISQLGFTINYLNGSIKGLNEKLDKIKARGDLGAKVIRAQEEERRRIAREIHDGPAQLMASAVLRAEICERLIDQDIAQTQLEIKKLKEMIRHNLREVRKIIYDLRPMALDDLGLIPALKRYLEKFQERFRIKTILCTDGKNIRLPNTLEVAIFRVVQESLQNVSKHAQASKVYIDIIISEKEVEVEIKDNGRGFDIDGFKKDNKKESFGILGMKERVELFEGTFKIDSIINKGTKIKLTLPLIDKEVI